jgi:glycosyltransferase involved in cell wall biosynthesis
MRRLWPKCFEALMNQTYKNFEFIFVDDGSTDNSIEIEAKKISCKIFKTPKKTEA